MDRDITPVFKKAGAKSGSHFVATRFIAMSASFVVLGCGLVGWVRYKRYRAVMDWDDDEMAEIVFSNKDSVEMIDWDSTTNELT